MSDAASIGGIATTAVNPSTLGSGAPTVPVAPVRQRMSEMGHAGYQPSLPPIQPNATPANTQQPAPQKAREPFQPPPAAEPVPRTPEEQPGTAEPLVAEPEAEEGALTAEQQAAKYAELMSSPDLDVDAFADKTIWIEDREGNQVPMRLGDVQKHVMLYRDYQHKTTEYSRKLKGIEQREGQVMAFGNDFFSGDPDVTQRALRWAAGQGPEAEQRMKQLERSLILPYVQRMARLEEMERKHPGSSQEWLRLESQADQSHMLKRQLAAMQQQQQMAAQQQTAEQGVNAPDVQHVMNHLATRIPEIQKAMGVTPSDAFDRELGDVLREATAGERGPDGRWHVAPRLQLGRTPSDDLMRQFVGEAKERVDVMIARAQGRRPARQLPPPPAAAAVTGPAARPGQAGNISQPQRARFSDMR